MPRTRDLLIEIGTEELPPRALKQLGTIFASEVHAGLEQYSLQNGGYDWYATPRRLAVLIHKLETEQADHEMTRRGPSLAAAYDDGKPTRAAEGFARSCGVAVDVLDKLETDNGSWLVYREVKAGEHTEDLIPGVISNALKKLPIPRRMRWGDGDTEFVRPVHWCLVLYGSKTIRCELMGVNSGNSSRGHRFHHPAPVRIGNPAEYVEKLKKTGKIIVDFHERRALIEKYVSKAAEKCGGQALIAPALLDEVTALVEWPVAITGTFDQRFLKLPREVLIASMQDHQRYFPVTGNDANTLLNHFITVANIKSRSPAKVRRGNERVILPRLADAEFFWKRDTSRSLESYSTGLNNIVFQNKLGSLQAKSERIKDLSDCIAEMLEGKRTLAVRAAMLAKCDLLTEMVGEFPELQGVMGHYYAIKSGEEKEVARALDEQYMPRFAGDQLPRTETGRILSLADKIDTIIGIFGIGKPPTGDRDPFALRRAAIGVLRIIAECRLPLDLHRLIAESIRIYGDILLQPDDADPLDTTVQQFFRERARHSLREEGYSAEEVEAVLDLYSNRPSQFTDRLNAVREFMKLPEASGLAEANKRIINIISKSDARELAVIPEVDLFETDQEADLYEAARTIAGQINNHIGNGRYREALHATAGLHGPVTDFFDHVMVNADDDRLRKNRFALLHNVAELTNRVANISKLVT